MSSGLDLLSPEGIIIQRIKFLICRINTFSYKAKLFFNKNFYY